MHHIPIPLPLDCEEFCEPEYTVPCC